MQGCLGIFGLLLAVGLIVEAWKANPVLVVIGVLAAVGGYLAWKNAQRKQLLQREAAEQAEARHVEHLARARGWGGGSEALARDTDRDLAVTFLNAGHEEGQLTVDELNDRLELAMTARTHGDLARALRGLLH